MHPDIKQTHMTDFVILRKDQQQLCTDVRVYRGACCWTDYYLAKDKVRFLQNAEKPCHSFDFDDTSPL